MFNKAIATNPSEKVVPFDKALQAIDTNGPCLHSAGKVFFAYQATTTDTQQITYYFDQTVTTLKKLLPLQKQNQIDALGLAAFETLCRRIINNELVLDPVLEALLKKAPGNYQAIGDDLPYWNLYTYLQQNNRPDLISLLNP